MLSIIISKEIRSHILSLRFTVTFILFIVLVFAAIYLAVNEHQLETDRHSARVRVYAKKLDDILVEPRDWGGHGRIPRLFWNEGKSDAVPISNLAWLGQGLQPVLPVGVRTTEHHFERISRATGRNPLVGLLCTPDFVYAVNVVLSLLAILFMFDAVCGEKEAGTLRLTLSNSVPRHTLLLGKWIGGYLVLMIPFLIAAAGGMAYAWAVGTLRPDGADLGRITLLIVLACAYIAVFFNLSLFCYYFFLHLL